MVGVAVTMAVMVLLLPFIFLILKSGELSMLELDKESTTDKILKKYSPSSVNTTNKPVYLIELGSFKLSGADLLNLSSLSLILYLVTNALLKHILNSKLILTLAIILGSLVYWFFLSLLQIKATTKLNNKNNTNTES
jgi:hypothetical protein